MSIRLAARDDFGKGGAQSRTHGHGRDMREAAAAQRESPAVAGHVVALERTAVRREERVQYKRDGDWPVVRPALETQVNPAAVTTTWRYASGDQRS